MAKTQETLDLEKNIKIATLKMGTFGCLEVTIGFGGKERVDYMTYDTQGIFRCYEIKVSKSDFHSKHKNSFVGHYNYYVLTKELYNQVAEEIPDWVGVYVGQSCVKKPKKQDIDSKMFTCRKTVKGKSTEVSIPWTDMLKDSFIRSLYRDSQKLHQSENQTYLNRLKSGISRAERLTEQYRKQFTHLYYNVIHLFGHGVCSLLESDAVKILESGELMDKQDVEKYLSVQQRIYLMDRKQLALYLHSFQAQEYTIEEIEKLLSTRGEVHE